MYKKWIKRLLGIIFSFIAIIILFPFFLILAIIIKIESPTGHVFFTHDRIGKNKVKFKIYKFRSMKPDAPGDVPTHLLKNPNENFTRIGKFLRRTSLDELPQLLNILKGEMSFVGPRPALWNQDDLIKERDKYAANDILPGLTGWAQVNGRDELPIKIKAAYDGEYVNKMSFCFDVKCLFKTVISVFKGSGVAEGGKH